MFAPRRPSKPSDDKRPPVSPQPKISLFDGLRKAFTIKKPSSPAPEFTILEDDPTDVPYIRPVTRTRIPSSVINSAIQSPFQQNIFASIHAVPTARLRRPSNLSFVSVEDAGTTTSPTPSLGSLEDDDVDYFDEVEETDDEEVDEEDNERRNRCRPETLRFAALLRNLGSTNPPLEPYTRTSLVLNDTRLETPTVWPNAEKRRSGIGFVGGGWSPMKSMEPSTTRNDDGSAAPDSGAVELWEEVLYDFNVPERERRTSSSTIDSWFSSSSGEGYPINVTYISASEVSMEEEEGSSEVGSVSECSENCETLWEQSREVQLAFDEYGLPQRALRRICRISLLKMHNASQRPLVQQLHITKMLEKGPIQYSGAKELNEASFAAVLNSYF